MGASMRSDKVLKEAVHTMDSKLSSLLWAAYTLFKSISGGMTWGDSFADSLQQVHPMMVLSFVLYIFVSIFCVLNVVTAAFVDAAARRASEDDATLVEHINSKMKWIDELSTIFTRRDIGGDGYLDWEEFKGITEDWRT